MYKGRKLPIEELTDEEFDKLLEGGAFDNLTDKQLNLIEKNYGIGKKDYHWLYCDEMHGHNADCFQFFSRHSKIVSYLLDEIRDYRSKIRNSKSKKKFR